MQYEGRAACPLDAGGQIQGMRNVLRANAVVTALASSRIEIRNRRDGEQVGMERSRALRDLARRYMTPVERNDCAQGRPFAVSLSVKNSVHCRLRHMQVGGQLLLAKAHGGTDLKQQFGCGFHARTLIRTRIASQPFAYGCFREPIRACIFCA
ncbi:hypothetical protein [Burkholderia contaminans]|uniref:hypothetical protein n=1 Tax=Burkholderia contaminans TaxID=488447 RepID=UPI0020C7418E|nr:hypothetical protein [Burkholderia contaminans]